MAPSERGEHTMLHHYYTPYSPRIWRVMTIGLGWMTLGLGLLWGARLGRYWGWWTHTPAWVSPAGIVCAILAIGCWVTGQWMHDHPRLDS